MPATRLGDIEQKKTDKLDWSASRVTDKNASDLATALEINNKSLHDAADSKDPQFDLIELNFDGADLTDHQFKLIMKGIEKHKPFTKISLRFNQLTDDCVDNIVLLIEKGLTGNLDISGNDSIENSEKNKEKIKTALIKNKKFALDNKLNSINFISDLSIDLTQQSVQESSLLGSHGDNPHILLNNSRSLPKTNGHTSVFDEKSNSPKLK
jgi:hypothetical protein